MTQVRLCGVRLPWREDDTKTESRTLAIGGVLGQYDLIPIVINGSFQILIMCDGAGPVFFERFECPRVDSPGFMNLVNLCHLNVYFIAKRSPWFSAVSVSPSLLDFAAEVGKEDALMNSVIEYLVNCTAIESVWSNPPSPLDYLTDSPVLLSVRFQTALSQSFVKID
jgi:hypothetical protein